MAGSFELRVGSDAEVLMGAIEPSSRLAALTGEIGFASTGGGGYVNGSR
jgi:hypothetical protein